MVFEAGAEDLLAVVKILGADEADYGVDQHGAIATGDRIGARLQCLLVDSMMGIGGEAAALASLEVHDVVTTGFARIAVTRDDNAAALQLTRHPMGLVEQRDGDAEGAVGGLRPADGLEDEVERSADAHRLHLRGDVGEYAALGGDGETLTGHGR